MSRIYGNTRKIYPPDWVYAICSLFMCWFRSNEKLERRLQFLDAAFTDKGKARWTYRLLTWAYKNKIKKCPSKIG